MKSQKSINCSEGMSGALINEKNKYLSFLWLEITEKCNLTCAHCYADSSPFRSLNGSMNHKDWQKIIDEASDLGCREMQFIGGEPTLHPSLMNLIEHASKRSFSLIEVFTNATHLKEEMLGCFRRHNVSVATSFYSEDSKVHDQITQGAGSWHRTVTGIRNVINSGVPIRVGIIEMEQNFGQASGTISFLHSIGVNNIKVDHQRGVGRAQPLTTIESRPSDEQYHELCGECWKGKLCVTSTGAAYPCVFSRNTMLGNAKAGLRQILSSRKLLKFRDKIEETQKQKLRFMDVPGKEILFQEAGCIPGDCNPGAWCGPQSCAPSCGPGSGPCGPACGPSTCAPGSGPCWPACAP